MKKTINVAIDRPGLWLDADVTYGQVGHWFGHTTKDLKMDVIYPHEGQDKSWPCIVWICGGAWLQMDVHAWIPNLVDLARKGYVVASVEYRDSNYAVFPGQVEDIKKAIRYLRAHSQRYQIDPDHIGVMGESAGGHLAGMIGTTGHVQGLDVGEYLDYSSAVQAACPWYIPSDFQQMPVFDEDIYLGLLPESRLINSIAKVNPDKAKEASPITYIDDKTPPFLLIHGTQDQVVPHNQSELMYEALEAKGLPVDLISIEGADHADKHFSQRVLIDEIAMFFDKHLK